MSREGGVYDAMHQYATESLNDTQAQNEAAMGGDPWSADSDHEEVDWTTEARQRADIMRMNEARALQADQNGQREEAPTEESEPATEDEPAAESEPTADSEQVVGDADDTAEASSK